MYRVVLRSFVLILPLMAIEPASAQFGVWVDGQNMRSPFMHVYGESMPPIGHIRFCRLYPDDCRPKNDTLARFALSPDRWAELVAVNKLVNRIVEPTADQELYGEIERWTYPENRGDCEDYVLLKRRMLMERGWPASSLLITVVTDEKGEGHAILTARTKNGDYILDNKNSKVLAWNEVPYRFYKRQSYRNPRQWVSLKPVSQGRGPPSSANK
jgi:predicted transglutaminase-like cysteine proteinase